MNLAKQKNILVVDAHPDTKRDHFVNALATQYAAAAEAAGHLVQVVRLSELKFPWLRNAGEFAERPPGMIGSQQQHFRWADHVVLIYPLWLGSMPAMLKSYLEQVMRPGFAFAYGKNKGLPKKLLTGKSARIVVTDTSRTRPTTGTPSPDDEHGRGLLLVEALAHAWGSEPVHGGKRVWAELRAVGTW